MTDTTKPNGDHDRQHLGLQYHLLPDDPLAALNVLREAAGLEPWPAQMNRLSLGVLRPLDAPNGLSSVRFRSSNRRPTSPAGAR